MAYEDGVDVKGTGGVVMVVPQVDPDLYCLEALYHRRVTDAVTVTDNSFSRGNDLILLTKTIIKTVSCSRFLARTCF